jgi:hypothetical protein
MDELSPQLTCVLGTWRGLRQGTPYPRRDRFDPMDFRAVLGMLSLLEVHRDPTRFKYRVHGSDTARWIGYDLTGKFVDEGANKAWAATAAEHLGLVATNGLPSYQRHFNRAVDERYLNIEALVLPLASDGYQVDLLISVLVPHWTDAAWRAQKPRTEIITLNENGEIMGGVCSDFLEDRPDDLLP